MGPLRRSDIYPIINSRNVIQTSRVCGSPDTEANPEGIKVVTLDRLALQLLRDAYENGSRYLKRHKRLTARRDEKKAPPKADTRGRFVGQDGNHAKVQPGEQDQM